MDIKVHTIGETRIAEVISEEVIIQGAAEILDLLGSLYYQDTDKIILHEQQITPAFFDLKTGIAGDILQKCSNYRVRLAIVGDFAQCTGKSIRDFIYESNKVGRINFLKTLSMALERLSRP